MAATTLKYTITATHWQIQDYLQKVSDFISDCSAFSSSISRGQTPVLMLEITADSEIVSGIMEVTDKADFENADCTVSRV